MFVCMFDVSELVMLLVEVFYVVLLEGFGILILIYFNQIWIFSYSRNKLFQF